MTDGKRRSPLRVWTCTWSTMAATVLGLTLLLVMAQSFLTRQLDTKGCEMSYMRPSYVRMDNFDTEHTRFATKYSLYLYREGSIDEDSRVWYACLLLGFRLTSDAGQRCTRALHPRQCW
jgi:glycosylphosphatidylinositol deacylase